MNSIELSDKFMKSKQINIIKSYVIVKRLLDKILLKELQS